MVDGPFTMQDIPGKGKGLVATRAIARGELVLAEEPLFYQSQPHLNETILAALCRLSDQNQRQYLSLENVHKDIYPPPLGIFKTNALPCGDNEANVGVAANRAAIFLVGSRFNSSCQPNVNNYWNDTLQKITFWASSDIAEGEELCICYADEWAVRDDRRRRLESSFRFVCQCVACSREGDILKKSDGPKLLVCTTKLQLAETARLLAFGRRATVVFVQPYSRLIIVQVKLALRLLAQENLLQRSASFYYDAFQFCVCVSDVKNAKAWVTKAWKAYCITRGPDSEEAKQMAVYMKDVRQHRSFGLLSRATLNGPDS